MIIPKRLQKWLKTAGLSDPARAAQAVLLLRDQVLAAAATASDAAGSNGDAHAVGPPDEFLCPISCEIMEEPVTTLAGNTYENTHIMAWFRTHQTDPLTNTKLSSKRLVPNNSLRSQIQAWTQANPREQLTD
jgi:hypothetical protein